MTKLAHSKQETMDEIEARRMARECGEKMCPRCEEIMALDSEPDGCRDPDCPMLEESQ